jgi:fatty acid desaturase
LGFVEEMAQVASYYERHAAAWRREVLTGLDRDLVKELHRRNAASHFAVSLSLFAALALALAALWQARWPWLWPPGALVAGWAVFNCTVLLHEALHRTVFASPRPRLYSMLEWSYALPTGISPSQFTRWHLDHHAQLGSPDLDPKRHRLSPRRNARWLKMLYFTPALFVIYFRAARRETATYPEALRQRIARERLAAILVHLAVVSAVWLAGGGWVVLRVYVVPLLVVFPAVFALNRLGQHYAQTPEDPAGWSTRVKASWLWDVAFLWSARHLEHHAFPAVPFYRLPRLSRALSPLLDRHAVPERGFLQLLWLYLIRNRAPHSDWGLAAVREEA